MERRLILAIAVLAALARLRGALQDKANVFRDALKIGRTHLQDATPVRSFLHLFGRKPAVVWHDSKLGETLSMFKSEKSHMAIVRDVECEGEVDNIYDAIAPSLLPY